MGKRSAMYQFCVIHTSDNTDGKVTDCPPMSIVSEKVHRLEGPSDDDVHGYDARSAQQTLC